MSDFGIVAAELKEPGRLAADDSDALGAAELEHLRAVARNSVHYKPGNREGRFVLHLLHGVAALDARLLVFEEFFEAWYEQHLTRGEVEVVTERFSRAGDALMAFGLPQAYLELDSCACSPDGVSVECSWHD
jgi:hypothetical protein